MKLQRRDSYQPRERGDHSKRWIRGGEGSMPEGRVLGGVSFGVLDRRVRIVWSGREGSHESIYWRCQQKNRVAGMKSRRRSHDKTYPLR